MPIPITVPVAHYPNVKHSQLGNYQANLLHLKTALQGESPTVWYKHYNVWEEMHQGRMRSSQRLHRRDTTWCNRWHVRRSACWFSSDVVSPHGSMLCQTGWQAMTHQWLSGPEQTCIPWDSPQRIPFSPGKTHTPWEGEVGWNQAYSRLSTTHGHITDCKLYSVVYAGVCVAI